MVKEQFRFVLDPYKCPLSSRVMIMLLSSHKLTFFSTSSRTTWYITQLKSISQWSGLKREVTQKPKDTIRQLWCTVHELHVVEHWILKHGTTPSRASLQISPFYRKLWLHFKWSEKKTPVVAATATSTRCSVNMFQTLLFIQVSLSLTYKNHWISSLWHIKI